MIELTDAEIEFVSGGISPFLLPVAAFCDSGLRIITPVEKASEEYTA